MNPIAAITHTAQYVIAGECEQKKRPYRINVAPSLPKIKESIVLLFIHSNIINRFVQSID